MRLEIFTLPGIGEIAAGHDLAAVLTRAAGDLLTDGDILAISSKIVAKAEGTLVEAADRERAITEQTVRVVATRTHPGGVIRIVQNRQGLVLAAAGVDTSNVPEGFVLPLPADPDASARRLCVALREATGLRLGVLVTDTAGRAWRTGQTDIAIGAAGLRVLDDLRGTDDHLGQRLGTTVIALGDEIAAAADLVKGKARRQPVAVVRGLGHLVGDQDLDDGGAAGDGAGKGVGRERGAARLIRPAAEDMFRLGTAEAYAEGVAAGQASARTETDGR